MDPNENVKRQVALAVRIYDAFEGNKPFDPSDAHELAELVLAYADWLRNGGFTAERSSYREPNE